LQPSRPPGGSARATKGSSRSARRRARELALQGLYQWLLAGRDAVTIEEQPLDDGEAQAGADVAHYRELLTGAIEHAADFARASPRISTGLSKFFRPLSMPFC